MNSSYKQVFNPINSSCGDCEDCKIITAPPPQNCGWKILHTKRPYTCPVCFGRGFVQSGFYNSTGNTFISHTLATEECRSCKGTGVIWSD